MVPLVDKGDETPASGVVWNGASHFHQHQSLDPHHDT